MWHLPLRAQRGSHPASHIVATAPADTTSQPTPTSTTRQSTPRETANGAHDTARHRSTGNRYGRHMPISTVELTPAALEFVTERHLATLTTLRADGTPHVVAVGFTWDPEAGIARVITNEGSVKVKNTRRSAYAAVSQVDGIRWLTLEGPASVHTDTDNVVEAENRYAQRYRVPRENPNRVVITIQARRLLASSTLTTR